MTDDHDDDAPKPVLTLRTQPTFATGNPALRALLDNAVSVSSATASLSVSMHFPSIPQAAINAFADEFTREFGPRLDGIREELSEGNRIARDSAKSEGRRWWVDAAIALVGGALGVIGCAVFH